MHISILALGSRGDVQPLVTLGQALQARGHRVRVATFASFGPLVAGAGLELFPLAGDAPELLRRAAEGMLGRRHGPLEAVRALRRSYGRLAESLPRELAGLGRTDLILNQLPAHLFGPELSERLGAPWAVAAVIPLVRTRYCPLVGVSAAPGWLPGYNRLTYRLGEQIGWQLFRASVNRLRRAWGMAPQPLWGPYAAIHRGGVPFLCGFSPLVVPRPPDWGPHIHMTGWWYAEERGWPAPPELLRFLEDGPPPLFVGFGSMPVDDPARVTALVAQAARSSGLRVLLQAGWAGLGGDLPPQMFPLGETPYGWLFPRCAGLVHHGGSGSTGYALRAGVPSLVVPFGFDQHYWGERTRRLGAGPAPLPFRTLSAAGLAAALERLAHDPALRAGAAALGRRLAAERGVERAVALIEGLGARGR